MIFIHMTSHLCRNLCLLLSECNLSRDALDDNKDDLTGYSEFGKMAWEAKTQMCLTGKKASLSIYVLNTDNFQLDRGLFWSGLVIFIRAKCRLENWILAMPLFLFPLLFPIWQDSWAVVRWFMSSALDNLPGSNNIKTSHTGKHQISKHPTEKKVKYGIMNTTIILIWVSRRK